MMKDLIKKDELSKKEIIKRTIMIIVLLALAVGAEIPLPQATRKSNRSTTLVK